MGSLPQAVQTLTDYLKEIEVVLNFLSVSAFDNQRLERPLDDFKESVFGAARGSSYILPEIQLKHAKHLWFIVRLTQAGCFIEQNQVQYLMNYNGQRIYIVALIRKLYADTDARPG